MDVSDKLHILLPLPHPPGEQPPTPNPMNRPLDGRNTLEGNKLLPLPQPCLLHNSVSIPTTVPVPVEHLQMVQHSVSYQRTFIPIWS